MIEAGSNTFSLDLHPRLTVVAGVGRLERDGLISELIGALASSRSGVHLELVEDTGRRLAVFRPNGAKPRVVDVDHVQDVTEEFRDAAGNINLLAPTGLDLAQARRKLRFGASDLTAATHGAQLVRSLASLDQNALWGAAEAMVTTERALAAEAEALGSAPEDAEVIERVEARHQRFENLQERHDRLRRMTMLAAAVTMAAAIPVGLFVKDVFAFPLLLVACICLLISVITRSRMERARKAESDALAEAGAQSYLGFHLQRVNGMLSSEAARKRLMAVAEANRTASTDWRSLAGDIPVQWALEHHEEITAAARVRIDITAHATMSTQDVADDDTTTDLARVLVSRLAELRRLGGSKESFPLVLDDPLVDLDRGAKPALLELLSHTSGSPQLVYLTSDEDVASWARLEALTGALSIIEPAAAPAADERHPRRRVRSN